MTGDLSPRTVLRRPVLQRCCLCLVARLRRVGQEIYSRRIVMISSFARTCVVDISEVGKEMLREDRRGPAR